MDVLKNLMAPLNRDHCMLFYYLGFIYLAFALFAVLGFVMSLFKKNGQYSLMFSLSSFISSIAFYYLFRIAYSMCLGSLH